MRSSSRPAAEDYDPYYAGYVGHVPEGEITGILRSQLETTASFLASLPEARHTYRYQPDKWSVCQVVGHIVDTERIFSYRALRIARADLTPMSGMDQDDFMAAVDFDRRGMASLIEEYRHSRAANLALFDSFDDDVLERRGTASGCPFTVRALLYVIAGHEIHHLGVLKERYL